MPENRIFIIILLMLASFSSTANDTVERLFWDKVPLKITLAVGKERLVTFPAAVRLAIPGILAEKLRTQSNQGTVYWKASESFQSQRIEIREITSKQIYLIDLKASKSVGSVTPLVIINKQQQTLTDQLEQASTQQRRKMAKSPGYVALTRFAAQQLYAPARLLKALPQLHRVSVTSHTTTHLFHGEQIEATPVASWQSGTLYVTALVLKNTSQQAIVVDPRKLRGEWRAATFQYTRLHPSGSESDTTAVYLISDRPYHEAH